MNIKKYLTDIKPTSSWQDFLRLCYPILIFPIVFLPYALWGVRVFMAMASRILYQNNTNPLRLLFTGNNTILLFWMLVTAVVMVISLIVGLLKLRPWYFIPIYLAVMFSLCGILSLCFYNIIVR